jgi:CubicO group peptidase (beta-lactamase class C family)
MARGSAEDAVSWFAEEFRETCAAPALSLAVARAGEVIWQHAWGKADLEFDVRCTPEHRFRIGSVSKVLTTVAAAKLVTRGLLELETPIAYWLPDLPERHRATTMPQLLTHRGGIRHYGPKDVDPKTPGGPIFTRGGIRTTAEILEAFIDDDLVAPVGEAVSYSSFGYSLASIVMEAAAKQDFLTLIDEEIGRPIGLASLAADQPGKIVYGRVRGYVGENERRMLQQQFPDTLWPDPVDGWANAAPINPSYCWAGAGFLMSMPDMARFGAAMLDGRGSAITENERALLFTPLTEATKASPPLGLGWRVDEDTKGRLRWHHAGATAGGRAGLIVYPELGLSIALAGNTMISPGDVLGPASRLADIFG